MNNQYAAARRLAREEGIDTGEREPEIESVTASWPAPMDDAAYHGVMGDLVKAIEPHTEADPIAVLAQGLTMFGNAAGRTSFHKVEATEHSGNLFTLIVGATSRARKGTGASHVLGTFERVDEVWRKERVKGGLSSGEGLIWHVRDGDDKDSGVSDKRLMVHESEFASVLKAASREGNTLSATLRQAWDGSPLATLTKNSPARAIGAHVSVVGHITRQELKRYMTETETANGFANRFLFFCVRRAKVLPRGGNIKSVDFNPYVKRLSQALTFAKERREIVWSDAAGRIWDQAYLTLSADAPGMAGAVISRAEAQTIRLALVYALLDCSPTIEPPHLKAALSVWSYAEDSARFLFGESLGNSTADTILKALKDATPVGLTRTQISNLLSRHATAARISSAMQLLFEWGLIEEAKDEPSEDGGRPATRYLAKLGAGS